MPLSLRNNKSTSWTRKTILPFPISSRTKLFKLVGICQVVLVLIIYGSNTYGSNLYNVRRLLERSTADRLVVYNAVGGAQNLAFVNHSRNTSFPQGEWDCQIFMYAKEDRIPDDNEHLRNLIDNAGCTVPRTPGIFWGNFLQFITPTLVSNYDYVALVLDDVFIPTQGENAVNIDKMIEEMETHQIGVMSPGIVGDTHGYIGKSKEQGVDKCIAEARFQETYLQIFTRDAWECYYDMLHYEGGKGWFYDVCYKPTCPHVKIGYDFSMEAYHVKTNWLPADLIEGTDLVNWKEEPKVTDNKYFDDKFMNPKKIKERLDCRNDNTFDMKEISCPSLSEENIESKTEGEESTEPEVEDGDTTSNM